MSRISQEYYDETVLENEETFELTPDEAIAETISQLASQLQLGDVTHNDGDGASAAKAALSDLILISHPHSEQGLMERKRHVEFVSLLTRLDNFVQPNAITGVIDVNDANVGTCIDSIEHIQTVCETSNEHEHERYRSILEREMGLLTLQSLLSCSNDRVVSSSLACLGSLMQNTFSFREDFKAFDRLVSLLSDDTALPCRSDTDSRDADAVTILQRVLTLATVLCTKCEPNKNSFLRAKAVYRTTIPPNSRDAPGGSAVLLQTLSTWLRTPPPAASNDEVANHAFDDTSVRILGHCCNLVASLCKYDDFRAESSSANETASMFYRAGIVPLLMNGNTDDTGTNRLRSVCAVAFTDSNADNHTDIELQISAMAAVRALCVNDDIVQSFVAGGVLELVANVLKDTASLLPTEADTPTETSKPHEESVGLPNNNTKQQNNRKRLLSITLGVIRNLCGNDTIKTNLCQDEITLPLIISTMTARTASSSRSSTNNKKHSLWAGPTMLEHSCGILAAMALRSPTNANLILSHHGSTAITSAMAMNPHCVPVLRQGCLAIRNLVSRNKETIPKLLDGVYANDNLEHVLRDVAGKQQGSVDEAYAALRDLGLSAKLITMGGDGDGNVDGAPQANQVAMFGDAKPRFRHVFEESDDMEGRIQNHIDVSRGPT